MTHAAAGSRLASCYNLPTGDRGRLVRTRSGAHQVPGTESPANQVMSDLASFWANAYPQIENSWN